MNAEKIDRAVIDSGTETRTIELDSARRSRSSCRGQRQRDVYGADGQPAEVRIVR